MARSKEKSIYDHDRSTFHQILRSLTYLRWYLGSYFEKYFHIGSNITHFPRLVHRFPQKVVYTTGKHAALLLIVPEWLSLCAQNESYTKKTLPFSKSNNEFAADNPSFDFFLFDKSVMRVKSALICQITKKLV